MVCVGEVTSAHRWNCQSHGRRAFGVWEDTSGFQGKSWYLAEATGRKRIDIPWKALEYHHSQNPYDGSYIIVNQSFRTDCWLYYRNGLYSRYVSRWYILLISWWWQGELQHKHSKSAYANSNKGHDKDFQIAKRAFQRHKMDAIRRANKLRGHDLQRPTEKMHILNSDRKRRVRAPRGYHIRKLLQDMGDDSSCTVSYWLHLRLCTVIDVVFTAI